MTPEQARAAVKARRDLEQNDYLLSEIVRCVIGERRWQTMPRLLATVQSWLGRVSAKDVARAVDVFEQCGLAVRRRVRGRKDCFGPWWGRRPCRRARGKQTALAAAAERWRMCIAAGRDMANEERARAKAAP